MFVLNWPPGELSTYWGRVTHICIGKLTIIGSDNGLSPERCQAIIWTNAGILLIGPLGTNFSEILIEIQTFSLKKIRLKMSSAKCCSFRLGLNVLTWNLHSQALSRLTKHSVAVFQSVIEKVGLPKMLSTMALPITRIQQSVITMFACLVNSDARLTRIIQDKVRPWWRHPMEHFPCYWPFVWGIHRSPVNSPHKGQWRRALMFSLICAVE